MYNDLISVIIPAYNCQNTIVRCIDSLLNQTYNNIEIIVVDDGSNDNTLSLLKDIESNHSNVKVFTKANGGSSSARNLGIKKANGDYICFVDSDDYVTKDYIYTFASDIEKADYLVTGVLNITHFRKYNESLKTKSCVALKNNFSIFVKLYKKLLINCPCNKIFKKSLIGNFDETMQMGEDLVFNLDYLTKCKTIKSINKCTYIYDKSKDSVCRSFRKNAGIEQAFLMNKLIDFCSDYFTDFNLSDLLDKIKEVVDLAFLSPFDYNFSETQIKKIYSRWINDESFVEYIRKISCDDFNDIDNIYNHYYKMSQKNKNKLSSKIKRFLSKILSK